MNKYELHLKVGIIVEAESVEKGASKIEDQLNWSFDECTYCKPLAFEEIEEEEE